MGSAEVRVMSEGVLDGRPKTALRRAIPVGFNLPGAGRACGFALGAAFVAMCAAGVVLLITTGLSGSFGMAESTRSAPRTLPNALLSETPGPRRFRKLGRRSWDGRGARSRTSLVGLSIRLLSKFASSLTNFGRSNERAPQRIVSEVSALAEGAPLKDHPGSRGRMLGPDLVTKRTHRVSLGGVHAGRAPLGLAEAVGGGLVDTPGREGRDRGTVRWPRDDHGAR
jgi:hypothetical protein